MIRRHQRKKRQVRQARQDAVRELDSDRGAYEPPSRDECDEVEWSYFAVGGAIRARTYLWMQRGVIVDFAVVFQVPGAEDDVEIERIDCCHGYVHLHQRTGEVIALGRLDRAEDVQAAFESVEGLTEDRMRILRSGGS